MSDDAKTPEPPEPTCWPASPPFNPDLDLIGDLERGQRAALEGDPSGSRRRRRVQSPA